MKAKFFCIYHEKILSRREVRKRCKPRKCRHLTNRENGKVSRSKSFNGFNGRG